MNNNITNNCGWIGSTHIDNIKLTSNILEKHIILGDINSSNYTSNTSNILNTNSSNYTNITSNIIQTNINRLIKEETEHILTPVPLDYNHTYIYNSNLLGEIRFWCKSTKDFIVVIPVGVPDYRVKIDVDGKLKVYYTYDPAINLTFGNGWVDVANSIVALNASDANFGISLGGLEAQITTNFKYLDGRIEGLLSALLGHKVINQEQYDLISEALDDFRTSAFVEENSIKNLFETIKNAFTTAEGAFVSQAVSLILYRISLNPATATFLGIGGVAFGFAVGFIQNQGYLNTISARIDEQLHSNIVISPTRRAEVISSNYVDYIDTYTKLCSNYSNFSLSQGFLNTNIQDIQYIPNLSTSNLYINTGNLNKLVASSSISENGILLSSKYLTSNHLYNLISTYSSERQFPPKLYTTTQSEDIATLLGKLVYRNLLYLDNSGISYGAGFYEVFSSSTYDTNTTKNKLFNFNISETTNSAQWGISLYNSGTGNYQGDNSIDNIYYGDWVILKMPQPIMLTRYRIYQNTQFPNRSPSEWKVYGSNDGITFTPIAEAHQLTRLLASDYTFYYYNKALAATFTTQYQYIGFVFNKLVATSGSTTLNFAELQIFGKEIISNTIDSNIYTTSNAVKGITQYQCPWLQKHTGFYCTISTPININGLNYYKYDVDLRNYTSLGVLQIGAQSGDTYRIFRIQMFYASMYFDLLTNNEPNICSYDVYMSWKQNGIGMTTNYQGLNMNAIGTPPNPLLRNILNTDLFIIRNGGNDINYITLMAKQSSLVRVIIEDKIS
jgi:hypothetical protein